MSFEPLDAIPMTAATLSAEVAEMEEIVSLLQRRARAEHDMAVLGLNWSAKPLTRAQIVTVVARRRGLREADMKTGQTAEKCEARHEAMWLMRQQKREDGEPLYSFPQIGVMFGQDHTTAMNGVERHELRLRLHAASAGQSSGSRLGAEAKPKHRDRPIEFKGLASQSQPLGAGPSVLAGPDNQHSNGEGA